MKHSTAFFFQTLANGNVIQQFNVLCVKMATVTHLNCCIKNMQNVITEIALFNIIVLFQIDLMPHDVITQLLRVLAIDTKQEKAIINAEPTEVSLSGLEAFSFDYIVKWPLSLIINRYTAFLYDSISFISSSL